MNTEQKKSLLEAARKAMTNAWAPYSGFAVGAAVLAKSGRIYAGCNVENASYPVSTCAERNALGAMVVAGEYGVEAILGTSRHPEPVPPCGMCRQAIIEFGREITVISVGADGAERVFSARELLPGAFGRGFLTEHADERFSD